MTETFYVPGQGRRAEARRRRRRQQRLGVLAAVTALVVLAVAVTVYLVRRSPEPPSAIDGQDRTQQTMLLQVRGEDGSAVAGALLAHDEAGRSGAGVLVPPQVIVPLPGAGPVAFGQSLAAGGPSGPRDALSDLLGVRVDASWVLDAPALAALVDALGGVPVTVDVPVVVDGQVLAPPGEQRLDGARAVAFLRYLAAGESELARLARFQELLDGVISALPDDEEAVTDLLAALGEGSTATEPASEVAAVLLGLQRAGREQRLRYETLPVIPIDPGGGVVAFRLDAEAARAMVDRLLAQSVREGARQEGNRVLVLNGVGTPGIGEAVRSRLVDEGFVFVGSRNAERFGYQTTQVLVPEATEQAQALGERVAAALGVEPDVRTAELGSVADVVVLVGADFAP